MTEPDDIFDDSEESLPAEADRERIPWRRCPLPFPIPALMTDEEAQRILDEKVWG